MTLRANPVERDATLPDGSVVRIRVGVPADSYIAQKELEYDVAHDVASDLRRRVQGFNELLTKSR